MLHRIQNNFPQLAVTVVLAAVSYFAVGVLIPSVDEVPESLSGFAPDHQVSDHQLGSTGYPEPGLVSSLPATSIAPPKFTEEEKLVFASLPPMCRPPENPSAAQFNSLPARPAAPADENAGLNPVQQAALAFAGSIEQQQAAPSQIAQISHISPVQPQIAWEQPQGHVQLAGYESTGQAALINTPTTPNTATPNTATPNAATPNTATPNTATKPPVARQASLHASAGPTSNPPTDPSLKTKPGEDPHAAIYSRSPFPSAKDCAQCHKQIYEEWASSSHAYASISPMFHVFEDTINRLSQGTIGYFCYRCHSPVSTTMGMRRDQAIWDGPPVFSEGVTCVACHRVKTPYGKVDGERRIEPGDIYDPVYGGGDGNGVSIAKKYSNEFKVKTERLSGKDGAKDKRPGQAMHRRAVQFEELSKSTFCVSCHQVAVEPGIKLEVVWDQYRASPAYREGVTCQDCHMGLVPGLDEGYSVGPGAVVNNRVVNGEKKHSNHVFYGPGYSIAHPGVFPHNLEANRWTVPQWLEFDWRAGWGTDKFEDALDDGEIHWSFPKVWEEADDRYDAREIVDANLKKLEYKRDLRRQLLENGSQLDGPFFTRTPTAGQKLNFRFCLTNLNTGHNMPSGSLGAQPQLWLNAVVIDPSGNRIWETGYLDSNGDLADNHSLDVVARKIPLDTQLMNLQTKFLTTNVKGTDREMYLPVNFDFDQLPFLRPPQQPVSVQNHPPFIRMEGHSIAPLGKRNIKFAIPARLMQASGTYRISVRMRSRAEPIYFMRFCNATPEMERMMNEWICDFHATTVTFEVR